MDSFYSRLKVWLAAHESDRRGALLMICLVSLGSGFASGRTLLIVAGLCMLFEGWAMLVAGSGSKR
jgi:hypothetical protein